MKKLLIALSLLFAPSLFAQTTQTSVTGTITDANSVAYYPATVQACLTPTTTDPVVNGQHVNPNQGVNYCGPSVQTSPVGSFTMALWPNSGITPGATQWNFTVTAQGSPQPAGKGPQTFQSVITISGASQSVSNTLSAAAPVLLNSGGGSSPSSSLFYIASNCGGLSNCLQWVDDDTTDNCGTATTNFMTAINNYAGPGQAFVEIRGSGSGKAYKLASCNLAFIGPAATGGITQSANVISNATIDCAQSTTSCIQGGKSGCPTSFPFNSAGCHDFTWRGGTITGCVNTTVACFEIMQGIGVAIIDDVTFNNTGAGNATLGTCTNYSIKADTFIGALEMSRLRYFGSVLGQCFSNNNDVTGGANTLIFTNNQISHTTGAACGGILHYDSSMHSTISNNTLFGFGAIIVLATTSGASEGGWMISGNNVDTSGCTIPSGQSASIQFGFPGSNLAVGSASISNNNGFTSPLIAQYPSSTAQMTGCSIVGNNTTVGSSALIGGSSLTCTSYLSNPCYIGMNPGYPVNSGSGAVFPGFVVMTGNDGHVFQILQGANISATNINGPTLASAAHQVYCQVILTRAATTSSTLPSCTVSWTDLLTGVVESATLTSTSTANTVGTQSSGNTYVIANTGTNITYSTSGYLSSGATSMQYAVFADIHRTY